MKGNSAIIDTLNKLLAGELTAVDQYLAHGEIYSDMGLNVLAEKALHESAHERDHATALIQRILFLEGTPNLTKRHALNISATVGGMLKADLGLEYAVAENLKDAVSACERQADYVTREMLVVQLKDTEEDHAYYLEQQLRLIEYIGLQNYIQSQMGEVKR